METIVEYTLSANTLSVKDYVKLWESVGWGTPPVEKQIEAGLKNSIISVAATHKNQVIGMGRVIGDGVIMCYILDLIVLPEFQGKGIGKAIMENLIAYVKDSALLNTDITIGLFTSTGLDKFYEKFGFFIRSSDDRGSCMLMHINKDGTIYKPTYVQTRTNY